MTFEEEEAEADAMFQKVGLEYGKLLEDFRKAGVMNPEGVVARMCAMGWTWDYDASIDERGA